MLLWYIGLFSGKSLVLARVYVLSGRLGLVCELTFETQEALRCRMEYYEIVSVQ